MQAISAHYNRCVVPDENKLFKAAIKLVNSPSIAKKITILLERIYQDGNINSLSELQNCYYDWVDDDMCEQAWKVHKLLIKQAETYKPNPGKKLSVHFSEMVYWAAYRKDIIVQKYDEVFIDEAQDNTPAQQALIHRMVAKGGRFIACGDPYQSIYSFMGADEYAFENYAKQPNTTIINLPISYRLPIVGVNFANTIFPNAIKVWDQAIEGEIDHEGSVLNAVDGDFVLCRNNKPLFEAYFYLLSNGKKCYIRDKELGEGLVEMVKPVRRMPFRQAMDALRFKGEELYKKIAAKTTRPDLNKNYIKWSDDFDILMLFAEKYDSFSDIYDILHWMFYGCEEEGVVLMTYHKSKGLETDNVFIIKKHLCPSKYATTPSDFLSEKKVEFVAVTRFKKKLIFDNKF
jgi:superfamily I DNA/RNA helicase